MARAPVANSRLRLPEAPRSTRLQSPPVESGERPTETTFATPLAVHGDEPSDLSSQFAQQIRHLDSRHGGIETLVSGLCAGPIHSLLHRIRREYPKSDRNAQFGRRRTNSTSRLAC